MASERRFHNEPPNSAMEPTAPGSSRERRGLIADDGRQHAVTGHTVLRTVARMAAALMVVATAVCPVSCSGPTQPSPVQSPQIQRIVSEIRGTVADTAFRRLADVKVEVVNGPNAGTFTTSDQFGRFSLAGAFSGVLAFRASKEGYVEATRIFDVQALCAGCDSRLTFGLESPDTVLRLEPGDYALTFKADPSCTLLPPELRTRTYSATISPASGDYQGAYAVHVPGLLFLQDRFFLGISGNYVATDDGGYPTLFGSVSPNTYLGIDFLVGTTSFEVSNGDEMSIPFPGTFEYCTVTPGTPPDFCSFFPPASVVAHERCDAPNNRMIVARR